MAGVEAQRSQRNKLNIKAKSRSTDFIEFYLSADSAPARLALLAWRAWDFRRLIIKKRKSLIPNQRINQLTN
jgi:hypothetical protein